MEKQSCFNCKNALIDGGESPSWNSPGYPACLDECKIKEVKERFDLVLDGIAEEDLPEKCGHYAPILVEQCENCHTIINQPEYLWTLWASLWDAVPVCSEKCKAELEAQFEKDLKDEK